MKNQVRQLLEMLASDGWVPMHILKDRFAQYNARIFDARGLGFTIISEKQPNPVTGKKVNGFRLTTPKGDIDWDTLSVKKKKLIQAELPLHPPVGSTPGR